MNSNIEILIIRSSEKELIKVESFLYQYFQKIKWPLINFNKVLLCISEAIINAIHHGNKNDTSKIVSVRLLHDDNSIYAEIKDEGKGFDFNCITDPTRTEYIKKESGRGLHIIRSICDSMEFQEQGACVKIKIRVR